MDEKRVSSLEPSFCSLNYTLLLIHVHTSMISPKIAAIHQISDETTTDIKKSFPQSDHK